MRSDTIWETIRPELIDKFRALAVAKHPGVPVPSDTELHARVDRAQDSIEAKLADFDRRMDERKRDTP